VSSMSTFETIQAGGVSTRACFAGEATAGKPGIVVFHPWWGLNDDVVAYADRLAGSGFAVVAPDLYRGPVTASIEEADRLSSSIDETAANSIALAAIDRLAERLGPTSKLATLGFSMGAAWSMWSPAERDRVVASVVYYGTLQGPSLARASVPVLGHFAETDPYETDEGIAEFEAALRSSGRDVTIYRYPGTRHWFAEPSRAAYRRDSAELAFERTLEFLGRHVGSGSR
jgi:carboxymethylenebutenolidase